MSAVKTRARFTSISETLLWISFDLVNKILSIVARTRSALKRLLLSWLVIFQMSISIIINPYCSVSVYHFVEFLENHEFVFQQLSSHCLAFVRLIFMAWHFIYITYFNLIFQFHGQSKSWKLKFHRLTQLQCYLRFLRLFRWWFEKFASPNVVRQVSRYSLFCSASFVSIA